MASAARRQIIGGGGCADKLSAAERRSKKVGRGVHKLLQLLQYATIFMHFNAKHSSFSFIASHSECDCLLHY